MFLIPNWVAAIAEYEGWKPGSVSWRNNNPGNVRDYDGSYRKFANPAEGFAYLKAMLENAATGKSHVYSPDMTLSEFFAIYAPGRDHNNPALYAKFVARKLGVRVDTEIKELV